MIENEELNDEKKTILILNFIWRVTNVKKSASGLKKVNFFVF